MRPFRVASVFLITGSRLSVCCIAAGKGDHSIFKVQGCRLRRPKSNTAICGPNMRAARLGMAAVGIVTNRGTQKFPTWALTSEPQTVKLRSLLAA